MRILIVDDNHDGARSLAAVLSVRGEVTRVVHNGAVAVKEAGLFKPHLILMDIGMAGLDGWDTCRAIRSHVPIQARIVAITGRDSEEDKQRSQDAGFDDHLVKPLDHALLEELLVSVRSMEADGEDPAVYPDHGSR